MQIVPLDPKKDLAFDEARDLAAREAGSRMEDPMLLAWLDRGVGRHSPDVDCCRAEGKETWEIYAESRGGSLRIEVGDDYVFIFREGLHAG